MTINVKDGGNWKPAKQVFVKDSGAWKEAKSIFVKVAGVWQQVFDSNPIVLEYRYFIELYGAYGGNGSATQGGQGGYTSFYLYPEKGYGGKALDLTIGAAANGTAYGSGWARGGNGVGPSTKSGRIGGAGGGSSAVHTGSSTYAVCGGGGGGGGGDSGQSRGGAGASPDQLSVSGSAGGSHDGDLGPGGAGGGGGLGAVGGNNGGDSGCGSSVNSPGAGGGGGGGAPAAGGSSPTDPRDRCDTTRSGGGGGGGGGLATLDGQVDDYRMVFNSISRGSYGGRDGYAKISVFAREIGSTGQWYLVTTYEYGPGGNKFDPSKIPTSAIGQPVITSPTNGSSLPNRTPTIVSSTFSPIIPTTHKSSSWQIAADQNFTAIQWQSVDDTSNLTSITVPSGALQNGTKYCRVKYTGANGYSSEWSPAVEYVFPVVKPTIQFSTNTPPTLDTAAGNGYTFSVLATDTSNTGSTISYQWYWNGQAVTGATDRFWNISPFYWSDSGSSLYCQVTATNSGQSSTANSQTCTLTVARSTVGERTQVTDFNNQVGFEKGDCSASQGNWDGPPQGVQIGSVGGGQGKLGLKSFPDIKWFMRKANFPSGNGCSNGRGTKMDGTIRLSVYDSNGNYKWSAYDKEFQMGTDNNDGTDSYSQPGQESPFFTVDTQIDLDPNLSYTIWLQVKRSTVEKCDCPNMNNCQNIGYAGGQSIKQEYKNQLRWGTTPFGYRNDTRPTPTPPP